MHSLDLALVDHRAPDSSRRLLLDCDEKSKIIWKGNGMRFVTALLTALLFGVTALAAAPADVPKDKQTKLGKYLTSVEAYDLLKKDRSKLLFLDTRTRAELAYVGVTSEIDANIPYVEVTDFWDWDDKGNRFKLEPNSSFGKEVEAMLQARGLTKTDQVVLICRSGDRSAKAANLLADLGYTNVHTVVDGFEGDMSPDGRRTVNGWKNAGLPWTYKLDKSKMYFAKRN